LWYFNRGFKTIIIVAFVICNQGKGLQKTYWLDGRKGMSLPLLSTQVDVSDDEFATGVRTTNQ